MFRRWRRFLWHSSVTSSAWGSGTFLRDGWAQTDRGREGAGFTSSFINPFTLGLVARVCVERNILGILSLQASCVPSSASADGDKRVSFLVPLFVLRCKQLGKHSRFRIYLMTIKPWVTFSGGLRLSEGQGGEKNRKGTLESTLLKSWLGRRYTCRGGM